MEKCNGPTTNPKILSPNDRKKILPPMNQLENIVIRAISFTTPSNQHIRLKIYAINEVHSASGKLRMEMHRIAASNCVQEFASAGIPLMIRS